MGDWRDIPGYDGTYQISRMGEVRSWRTRNGKPANEPRIVAQYNHGKSNHLFVKLPPVTGTERREVDVTSLMRDIWMRGAIPGLCVWHKNGNVRDNCLHNLAYITRSELGKKTGAKSTRRPVAKIDKDGNAVEFYPSARKAAQKNFMSYQAVMDRCNRKIKKEFALDGYSYRWDD